MSFRAYLHDRRLFVVGYGLGLLLLGGGLWLDPMHLVHLDTVVYISSLVTLLALGFCLIDYRHQRRFISQWQARTAARAAALDWPLPASANHEEAIMIEAFNQTLLAHRQAVTQLQEAAVDHQAFIDSWVHEIKVPLAAMTLLTESMEDQAPSAALDELNVQLDRVDHYVEQVLYYSRLESFSKDYLLQDYHLQALVNEVVIANRNSFISKHLRFNFEGPDALVTTDAKWLRFILMQLFSNAIKYTPDGGSITAIVAQAKSAVTLTIKDTGIGIQPDEQHRVFEKGFTGTNGRNANVKATGLGLYLAQELAKRLGHSLSLTATPNVGTAVTIHFPNLAFYGDSGSHLSEQPVAR
ncbi:sensor histidine kinase [Lacticaseibacillus jixiensis]|uniref:sensor histidine kinase n=1 Tax=Lacticaseibacillus jixiensis TaxID=3231926 RepID=UPI0036F295A0